MREYTHVRVLKSLLELLRVEAKGNGRSAIKQLEQILKERYLGK